ncbi:TTLL7 polyglutamylase, partial [Polypterus senegalus]|nr:TTLL7 polyglutamylase [Polypterus senegalus]
MTLQSAVSYKSTGKRKIRQKKKKGHITANVAGTKYEIVRIVIDEMVFMKTRDEDETANLIWNDSAVQHEKIAELRNYQRINHFPGMGEICRKDCLARNMAKMIKIQPQEYSFIPKTWIFPAEYTQFQNYVKELRKKRKQKTFIVKPANGAMGHGISLIRNCEKLPLQDHFIVQEYLEKPFLMEGYKFDLRIYILVTSCDPLRIFLYNDGLVRMGTEKYHPPNESNLNQLCMHLTNYSVNKHNENFGRDETADRGSKRSIRWFTEFLRTNDYDVSKFWGDISELVVKTLIVAEPHVLHAYRMCRPGQPPGSESVCFEVLGFDIILDRKLKPWLLEINRAPSFGTDQRIDYDVKKGVLLNAMKLLNIRSSDKKRNLAQQKAEAQKRLYGQGSMKRLSAGSSEWEKQRHTLERRKEELEEDILDLLEQCEIDDEKLMGKSTRQKGPKQLCSMPETTQTPKKQKEYSSNSSCNNSSSSASEEEFENEDILEKQEKKVSYDLEEDKNKSPERSSRINWKPPSKPIKTGTLASPSLSSPIRRSISCPRSISSLTGQSPTNEQRAASAKPSTPTVRPSSVTRSQSLNRTGSGSRVPQSSSLGSIHSMASRTFAFHKVICMQTLASLNEMRIRFPGKTDEEAELILDDILDNWKYHKPKVASYWLVKLDSTKQRKVLDIVRTNIRSVLQRIWKEPDIDNLHLYRLFNRVFNRLLWSHGQGLWNCFSNSGTSWETIFSKSTEVVTPEELQCCQRLVQLCRDCLLVVYKFVADSRGSLTGLSPEWDDTRYDFFCNFVTVKSVNMHTCDGKFERVTFINICILSICTQRNQNILI